jgi:uncharacterized SAM-binding protein YcdF (DUF218 family)
MYLFSKLAWALIQPSNLLLLLLILATAALLLGWRRFGTWLLCGVSATLAAITVLPIGTWLLMPIENRFAPPALPEEIDGVVVLGGAVEEQIGELRGQIALNDAAERVTALVELARRYPNARLVVSGGIGGPGHPARALEAFYREQGLDVARIVFEERSRNTQENAVLTRQLVRPGPDERWLLVTSAYHMPRSIGVFRAAGWPVIAYPVDYRTAGPIDLRAVLGGLAEPNVAERLMELDLAVKSWVGLVAYWLMGRTSALFPRTLTLRRGARPQTDAAALARSASSRAAPGFVGGRPSRSSTAMASANISLAASEPAAWSPIHTPRAKAEPCSTCRLMLGAQRSRRHANASRVASS